MSVCGEIQYRKKKEVGLFTAAIEINGTLTEDGHYHKMKL
jgi:hypothetical protein